MSHLPHTFFFQKEPMVAAVHFPTELERADRLAKDLDFLCGTPAWRDSDHVQRPSDAVSAYVARLRKVAEEHTILLLAHSYTRYLGDLSGGQILKRKAKKTYALPTTGEGVGFYEFPAVKSVRAFKEEYKTKLNGLELEVGATDALVDESNLAFKFNTDIFLEMDELCGLESLPVRKRKQKKKKEAGHENSEWVRLSVWVWEHEEGHQAGHQVEHHHHPRVQLSHAQHFLDHQDAAAGGHGGGDRCHRGRPQLFFSLVKCVACVVIMLKTKARKIKQKQRKIIMF